MYLLFFNIDHIKLIKNNSKSKYEALSHNTKNIISKWGGVVDDEIENLSIHPDGFEHSKVWLHKCVNEICEYFSKSDFLTGYTIILRKVDTIDYENVLDNFKSLNVGVFSINSVWTTPDVLPGLKINEFERKGKLIKISIPIKVQQNNDFVLDIGNKVTEKGVNSFSLQSPIDYNLLKSIYKLGESKSVDQFLYFYYDNSFLSKILFIKYLLTKENLFNPLTDLYQDEVAIWGVYLELYKSFIERNVSAYVLDSPELHLNKLICLWIDSFCKRHKALFVIKSPKGEGFPYNFFVDNLIVLVLEDKKSFFNDFSKTISNLNNKALRILYYICVTEGYLAIDELVNLLKNSFYSYIEVVDIIEHLRMQGLVWGDSVLYKTNSDILQFLISNFEPQISYWKNELIDSLDLYKNEFLAMKLMIDLGSDIDKVDPSMLRGYIDTYLDMCKEDKYDQSFKSPFDMYYKRRYSRIINNKVLLEDNTFVDESLSIQDAWTKADLEDLVKRSKNLYMDFQHKGDSFKEAKSKILFSLSLLAVGRIDEAIDYLELNSTYSLSINDRFSYLRSCCFLMCSMINKGNLTGALRVFNNVSQYGWVKLKTKWYLYSLFLASRAYGELSDYKGAIAILETAISEARDKSYTATNRVLHNWLGMYKFFEGDVDEAINTIFLLELNSESYLFLSYMEYFNSSYVKSLDYIEKARRFDDSIELYDENLVWRDGFYLVEEFCFRGRNSSILLNEINNFYYFISTLNGNDKKESLKNVVDNIPNESLFLKDIKALFLIYRLLEKENNFDMNIRKLVDKSIRLVQLRGNNIDSHNKKADYYKNYWNKIIMNYKS